MMPFSLDRKRFLRTIGSGSLALSGAGAGSTGLDVRGTRSFSHAEFAKLERSAGGRLGVHALHVGTGATLEHRADERFPMCSTHKVLTAAAVLAGIDEGRLEPERRLPYGPSDLLDYAPVTRSNAAGGSMAVLALCEAAVRRSDNTAANLLLKLIGGPSGWTRYARSIGDHVSRLDRFEPDLNEARPDDDRDTSTPRAMSQTLAALSLGQALSEASRSRLKGWMYDSDLTETLFRAGIPNSWHVADKSGAGGRGTRNDVGILYPPKEAPIILSAFLTGSRGDMKTRDAVVAESATIVAHHFG